jgi:hypothetical protein
MMSFKPTLGLASPPVVNKSFKGLFEVLSDTSPTIVRFRILASVKTVFSFEPIFELRPENKNPKTNAMEIIPNANPPSNVIRYLTKVFMNRNTKIIHEEFPRCTIR